MNIVICRNMNGKHAYLFKNFNIGEENVADLVLSTTKLGFSDIIEQLISNLKPNTIEEGLIYQVKDISSLEINNLLPALDEEDWYINMLNQAVAGDVKKVIYYSDNWHLYHEAEQIMIHPVAAQINYSYEYEERVYKK